MNFVFLNQDLQHLDKVFHVSDTYFVNTSHKQKQQWTCACHFTFNHKIAHLFCGVDISVTQIKNSESAVYQCNTSSAECRSRMFLFKSLSFVGRLNTPCNNNNLLTSTFCEISHLAQPARRATKDHAACRSGQKNTCSTGQLPLLLYEHSTSAQPQQK